MRRGVLRRAGRGARGGEGAAHRGAARLPELADKVVEGDGRAGEVEGRVQAVGGKRGEGVPGRRVVHALPLARRQRAVAARRVLVRMRRRVEICRRARWPPHEPDAITRGRLKQLQDCAGAVVTHQRAETQLLRRWRQRGRAGRAAVPLGVCRPFCHRRVQCRSRPQLTMRSIRRLKPMCHRTGPP